jgi:multiple sugar transport system permease protein
MKATIVARPGRSRGQAGFRRWRREARRTAGWGGLLYVVPALTLLLLFELWPILLSVWISFWRWDVRPVRPVGLENYRQLFGDGFVTRDYSGDLVVGEVAQSLIVTAYYVLATVPVTIALAFGLAYLLFQGIQGQGLLRTLYFLPHVTSSVAITLVFGWIFNAQVGVANAVMRGLGLPTQTWLEDPTPAAKRLLGWAGLPGVDGWPDLAAGPSVAMVVIIAFGVWSSLGFSIVVYLAGLTAIPRDLIDAARVDGAGGGAVMRSVVWPLLAPSTFFLLIGNMIGAFQVFGPIYTLTRSSGIGRSQAGGPLDTTLTITVLIFRNFYERANSVGYAATISFLLFFILLGLTLLQFRVYGRYIHYQQ